VQLDRLLLQPLEHAPLLGGIGMLDECREVEPGEKRRVLEWLEQQAVKLHALLINPPQAHDPQPSAVQALSDSVDRQPRRMKLPKVVTSG
jgi:hypothetical protein